MLDKHRSIISAILIIYSSISLGNDDIAKKLYVGMVENYLHYNSYQDSGVIYTEHSNNNYIHKSHFRTLFDRPDNLKFVWESKISEYLSKKKYTIIMNEKGVITYRTQKKDVQEKNIYYALSSLAGLTSHASYLVPVYLLSGITQSRLNAISSFELIGGNKYREHDVSIVKVNYKHANSRRYWIDKNSHLLRKFERTMLLDNGVQAKTTIEYTNIVINENINKKAFEYMGEYREIIPGIENK